MESKINRSNIFWTKTSEFCLRIISFSSLESELSFDSKDSKINFDRARSTTVKSLLGALRALYNREVKLGVYGKRQTAKIKLLPSFFSSLYSRIKYFVFAVNSKRHFSIFV